MASCPTCQGTFEGASFCPRDGSRLLGTDALLGGRYRLVRRVGEGAMGVVFEAEHVELRRRVAVKLLQRKLVANAEAVERMRREAQAMSSLGHPNIVDCTDFGRSDDGQVFLVMEWLDGENLDERLARQPVDVPLALDIAAQVCSALAEAHSQGVIHRDLKPANVFLARDRKGALRVKLLDFGIAKLGADQSQLTSTGVLIGTPNYMAPEQALGDPIDARTDLYALGIIVYEMLTGAVPFHADTPVAVLHQHTSRMPAAPSARVPDRLIPADVDEITMTCLAKNPADRYPTATALGEAIERARAALAGTPAGSQPSARPPAPTPTPLSDLDDDELIAVPRRAWPRWLAIAAAGLSVLAGGFAAVVLLAGHREPAPRRGEVVVATARDASTVTPPEDAVVVAQIADDAAEQDAPDAERAPTIRHVEPSFTLEGRVEPDPPVANRLVVLQLALSRLPPARQTALEHGHVSLRVLVQHFAAHDEIVHTTLEVDANGRAQLSFVPRAGKHHVLVEPVADRTSLGRTRFDLHVQPY